MLELKQAESLATVKRETLLSRVNSVIKYAFQNQIKVKKKHKDRLWNTSMGCPFCVRQNCSHNQSYSHKVVMDSS